MLILELEKILRKQIFFKVYFCFLFSFQFPSFHNFIILAIVPVCVDMIRGTEYVLAKFPKMQNYQPSSNNILLRQDNFATLAEKSILTSKFRNCINIYVMSCPHHGYY